jgi:GNAT superfamily N-acetyltransferase
MYIVKATHDRFDEIMDIYADAQNFMRENGNPTQWGVSHPSPAMISENIDSGDLYLCLDDSQNILCAFYFKITDEAAYRRIYDGEWLNGDEYGVIHHMAVSPLGRGRGIAGFCFDFAYSNIPNIKIDTHNDNAPMKKALAKAGFVYCGNVFYESIGEWRIAYQKSEAKL